MEDTNINELIYKRAQEIASKYCGHDDPTIQRERYQAAKTGFIGGTKYVMKLLSEHNGFDNNVEEQEDTVSENAKQYIAERSDVAECFPLQREFHVCS